jgi:hypothetical protein
VADSSFAFVVNQRDPSQITPGFADWITHESAERNFPTAQKTITVWRRSTDFNLAYNASEQLLQNVNWRHVAYPESIRAQY